MKVASDLRASGIMPIRASGRFIKFKWTDSGSWSFAQGLSRKWKRAVSARPIPETYKRQDWPRLVAEKSKDHETRIAAPEAGGGVVAVLERSTARPGRSARRGALRLMTMPCLSMLPAVP